MSSSTQPLHFACPECRKKYVCDPKNAGRRLKCLKCGFLLAAPRLPEVETDEPEKVETDEPEKKDPLRPVSVGELAAAVKPPALPNEQADVNTAAEVGSEIEVLPEYEQVAEALNSGAPLVFVTGGAGTGKSTLIKYLEQAVSLRSVVVAPTGVAALNAGGATIHSFFWFPPTIIQEGDIKTVYDRQLYTKLELLIIDEVSMVRPDLIDGIDMFLRKNRSSQEPFGGVQVLLIGDMYQLPPVVTQDEGPVLRKMGYETDFFFGAKSLSEMEMLPVFLERIFRQADPAFISILNDVREGERVSQRLQEINEQCVSGIEDEVIENNVVLTCTNVVADAKNRAELASLPTNMNTYTGSVKGEFKPAKDRLPAPMELELKLNAQVMFTKNDSAKRWVNGTIGRVIELKSDQICIEIKDLQSEDQVWVNRERWEKYKYIYDANEDCIVKTSVGEYSQFPLMLAWAVTIYKAQGQTLDNVLIDLGSGAFAAGQVYVGLSRVRSLENLRLVRPVHETDVKCDYEIVRFYQQLVEMAHIGDDEELPAIRSTTLNHRQTYNLRTHCGKLGKLSADFQLFVDFLDQMHDACPSAPFLTGPRASSIHAGPQPDYDDSTNHGRSKYTKVGLQQNAGRFEERHEQVQVYMLEHDDTTVAMEVPLWLEFDQAGVFQSIMSPGECLSGHVDVISIENNKIWIWDYKPNALKERWAHVQLSIYALMLSHRTQIPLDRIHCGYFDDELCRTFRPRQQHIDLFDFYSYVPSGQSRQNLLKKKPTKNEMPTIIFDSNGYRIDPDDAHAYDEKKEAGTTFGSLEPRITSLRRVRKYNLGHFKVELFADIEYAGPIHFEYLFYLFDKTGRRVAVVAANSFSGESGLSMRLYDESTVQNFGSEAMISNIDQFATEAEQIVRHILDGSE